MIKIDRRYVVIDKIVYAVHTLDACINEKNEIGIQHQKNARQKTKSHKLCWSTSTPIFHMIAANSWYGNSVI